MFRQVIFFLFLSSWAFAESEILQGALIRVDSYNRHNQTYQVTMMKYPDQGPNVTTSEELGKCSGIPSPAILADSPKKIVGQQYTLICSVPLLTEKQRLFRYRLGLERLQRMHSY